MFQAVVLIRDELLVALNQFKQVRRISGKEGAWAIVGVTPEGAQEALAFYTGKDAEDDSKAAWGRVCADSHNQCVIDLTRNASTPRDEVLALFVQEEEGASYAFRSPAEMEAVQRLAAEGVPAGQRPSPSAIRQALIKVRARGGVPRGAHGGPKVEFDKG
jgi:hypothetical protein